MLRFRLPAAIGCAGAICTGAGAQNLLINGDFETGQFPPWTISPTPSGASISPMVALWDIDGAGARPATLAARLLVGQTAPNTGHQGVTIAQSVPLAEGAPYEIRFDWSVWALVNVYNAGGGRFEIVVNGSPLAIADAPQTVQGQRTYGRIGARFVSPSTATHSVGVRVTRPVLLGEEVFQHLDNIRLRPACPGDVTENGSVGFDDLNAVLAQFGQTGAPGEADGDANFDGRVDFADLNIVLARFGAAC